MMKDDFKVVLAPQAFKDSLDGAGVADAMARGVAAVWQNAQIVRLPIADGGDGTLDILVNHFRDGKVENTATTDALGRPCTARWGVIDSGKTAVIETAEANGIAKLTQAERNARTTTTRGIGKIFQAALAHGCEKFIVGIGGSATNDGGAGLVQALGGALLDADGREIEAGGIHLAKLARIDLTNFDKRIQQAEILVSCDVTNPLTGKNGASAIFGPQKGATPQDVAELDAALAHFAEIIKRDLGKDVIDAPGAGAAGGLGAGLLAFFGARLTAGADLILDTLHFDDALQNADLLIVGEGKFDHSSSYNKAPVQAAKRAKAQGIPVIGIGGSIGAGYEPIHQHGINAVFSIMDSPMTLDQALKNAPELIARTTEQAIRAFALRQ